MNWDEIKYSLKNLKTRKLRSFLTVLSILMGISAIFAILSFGFGIQSYMDTIAEEAGTDKMFIMAKGVGAPGLDDTFFLTKSDINFVSKINGVNEILGMYVNTAEVKFKKEKKYTFIMGMDPEKQDFIDETFTVSVGKGRTLKKGELNKVLLGYLYQFENKFFKRAIRVGDKVEINGNPVEVVGFYEEIGNPQDDSNVYMTLEGMEAIYDDIEGKFSYVMLSAEKTVDPDALADKIQDKLRKYKGQEKGKEDFYVQTFSDMIEMFGSIMNILNGVLVLIALISLVVASVNIMNTMYTAVLERTKEIGIMKAIGAKNSEILMIFVFEAGLLGLVGGIMGVLIGFLISSLGGALAAAGGYSSLQPIFPFYLIFACLFLAFIVGAVSGFLPALKASRLNPVDALRYE